MQLMMILPEGLVLTQSTDMEAMKGLAATPPPRGSGRMFNRPTDIAIHPSTGDLFISDGYGNNVRTHVRNEFLGQCNGAPSTDQVAPSQCGGDSQVIHHLRSDGSHVKTWGGAGAGLGEFNTPHCIIIHPDLEHVIVCDRESNRLQVFDLDGHFVNWAFTMRPPAVCVDSGGNFYVAQNKYGFEWTPNIGNRIVVYRVSPAAAGAGPAAAKAKPYTSSFSSTNCIIGVLLCHFLFFKEQLSIECPCSECFSISDCPCSVIFHLKLLVLLCNFEYASSHM